MVVAEIESNISSELTNEQLLSRLQEFRDTQPSINFHKEDFFAALEQTDITYLIGEATERFASTELSENPQNLFSVTVTPINELPLMNARLKGNPPQSESKILKLEYLPDPQNPENPLLRIILPIDGDMRFDRGRQTRVTYVDKWRRGPYTCVMQAGVEQKGSGLGPKNSLNTLRVATGLLLETIESLEDSKLKKLAQAAMWQVGLVKLDGPRSVSESLNQHR